MKKYLMLVSLFSALALFSACDKDNNPNDGQTPQTIEKTYTRDDLIGTWNILEIRLKGEPNYFILDQSKENWLQVDENQVRTEITQYPDENVKYKNFTGVVNNKLYRINGNNQEVDFMEIVETYNDGKVILKHYLTGSHYKIQKAQTGA